MLDCGGVFIGIRQISRLQHISGSRGHEADTTDTLHDRRNQMAASNIDVIRAFVNTTMIGSEYTGKPKTISNSNGSLRYRVGYGLRELWSYQRLIAARLANTPDSLIVVSGDGDGRESPTTRRHINQLIVQIAGYTGQQWTIGRLNSKG